MWQAIRKPAVAEWKFSVGLVDHYVRIWVEVREQEASL